MMIILEAILWFSLVIILPITICVLIIMLIIKGVGFYDSYYSPNNKMRFKSFLSFYNIAPNKWKLEPTYVIYKQYEKHLGYEVHINSFEFGFRRLDLIKYLLWTKLIELDKERDIKQEKKKSDFENYQKAVECIKQDLEQFKQSKPWEEH